MLSDCYLCTDNICSAANCLLSACVFETCSRCYRCYRHVRLRHWRRSSRTVLAVTADHSTQCPSSHRNSGVSKGATAGGCATRSQCSATDGNVLERRAHAKQASDTALSQEKWLSNAVTEIATSAKTASFQKSRRCLSPGRPSGLMIWIAIIKMTTNAMSFAIAPLSRPAGSCQRRSQRSGADARSAFSAMTSREWRGILVDQSGLKCLTQPGALL